MSEETISEPAIPAATGRALPHALDGATAVDDLGAAAAGDYGDVTAEYRALRDDVGVVDRSVRGAVRVTGRDARSFLDSLVSQDLSGLADGDGAHSLLLQPMGKLTADFRILRISEEEFWLDTDVGIGSVLADGLNRFKIRVVVNVADVTAERAAIAVKGPNAPARVGAVLGVAVPDRAHAHVGWEGARVVRADWSDVEGVDVVGPRAIVEAAWDALTAAGVRRAGASALEIVRIESGLPRQGCELDESTIAQEAFLERDAVSFTKGCFLGQELVCRIDTRGHVNRLLRGILVDGGQLPEAAAAVATAERAVGRITSVARSPQLGVIALAFLRRSVEPGERVTIALEHGVVPGTVRELPLLPLPTVTAEQGRFER